MVDKQKERDTINVYNKMKYKKSQTTNCGMRHINGNKSVVKYE